MESIELQSGAKTYGNIVIDAQEPTSSSNPLPPNDLRIKRPNIYHAIHPPKGTL